MKRQRFFGACSSHTASWASCAGCSARALGRPSPFYADTAYESTTPHRITSPKLGVTRCSNSDPRNDHNELFAVTGPVARQCTPHRSQPPTMACINMQAALAVMSWTPMMARTLTT